MPTIAIDFDGVLHSYETGWHKDTILPADAPVAGAQRFIKWLVEAGYEVVIFSTRAETKILKEGMKLWLEEHDFPYLDKIQITDRKPKALIYIDDRAFRFNGSFVEAQKYVELNPRPWNKQ